MDARPDSPAPEPDPPARVPFEPVNDPLRERLGWLGRKLPATHHPIQSKDVWLAARRVSVIRTLYWSLRLGGPCAVGRGSKMVVQRTARVEFGPGGWLLLGLRNHGSNPTLLDLGRDAHLVVNGTVQAWRGSQIKVYAGGRLELGDKCIFNEDSKVICFKSIKFGDNSGMSWNATVMDSDLHPFSVGGRWLEMEAPVEIGDRSFVGAGAIVLKGVRLGTGTVVGAGAVVTQDQPARCLVAGNPARVIHEDIDWI